ncbi:MAG: hypothetical protein IIA89_12530 [Chloroflexi bacterium]|nr:hypothetical protein [Chloroflexota bacterium]
MTQLIGAICEDGKTVIAVSDRMVSTGDMTLTFEHPRMKAERLTEKAIVLTAGTVHEPDLLRQAREKAKGKDRILEIADVVKDVYQDVREKHIVDEVLRPHTGLTSLADWRNEQKNLHDHLVISLNEEIANYGLGLTLMLVGFDDEGHLIRINDPGTYRSYDNLSYCCLGMGNRHADNTFAWYRYSRLFPVNDALYIAFEAKKKAEMAGGVGSSTDILIINAEGTKEVAVETIVKLEAIYHDRESRRERTGFDKKITELEIQANSLEDSRD